MKRIFNKKFFLILSISVKLVYLIPIFDESYEKSDETPVFKWNYEKPNNWLSGGDNSCGVEYQSPIDITFTNLTCSRKTLKLLQLNEYDKMIDFKFIYNGHTLVAYPMYEGFPHEIDGGILPNNLTPYQLTQFHFHWGQDYKQLVDFTQMIFLFLNSEKFVLEAQSIQLMEKVFLLKCI